MLIFQDWIFISLFVLAGMSLYISLRSHYKPEIWLIVLTIFLFALPRAGVVLRQVNLPLPVGYVLVVAMILEWLFFREVRHRGNRRINMLFLLYSVVAGFGLILGLSAGGHYLTAFLELCFYLFAIGLFFYTSETFCKRHHFIVFVRLILIISLLVSVYGIVQKRLGTHVLVDNITYNSASETARTYLEVPQENRRVLSSYGDPNVLAAQLVVFVGISLSMLIGKGIAFKTRLFSAVVLAANVLCILFTGSRAGMLCLLIVPVVVLCWRTRWVLLLAPVLLWSIAINYSSWINYIVGDRLSMEIITSDIRMQFPAMAWELLKEFPFGCGFGRAISLKLHGLSWTLEADMTGSIWGGLNSFWLNIFSRLGVPGVTAFALLLLALFLSIKHGVRQIQDRMVRAFIIGGLSGFVGVILIWLVNNTYMLPGGELNFWFMMGMMTAGCRAFAASTPPVVLLPYCPDMAMAKPLTA